MFYTYVLIAVLYSIVDVCRHRTVCNVKRTAKGFYLLLVNRGSVVYFTQEFAFPTSGGERCKMLGETTRSGTKIPKNMNTRLSYFEEEMWPVNRLCE